MRTTIRTSLSALLLAVLFLSAAGRADPLPQDLRTETLLVLLFDKAPTSLRGAKKHNELVEALNEKTMKELEIYPYPSATMLRSKYEKKEDVPAHTYVLDGSVMKMFNDGEVVATSSSVYVGDVVVADVRSGKIHVVFESKSRTYHMFMKYALREIPKRMEKGN
jgi:hypothetical protein